LNPPSRDNSKPPFQTQSGSKTPIFKTIKASVRGSGRIMNCLRVLNSQFSLGPYFFF
jgi:hypothetical protein